MHLQRAVLVLHEEVLHARVEVQQEEVQLVEHGVECEMEFQLWEEVLPLALQRVVRHLPLALQGVEHCLPLAPLQVQEEGHRGWGWSGIGA